MLVNITIPVYNEEKDLRRSVTHLHSFLRRVCRFSFEVVIADNGSTDGTRGIAEQLSNELEFVRVEALSVKGRGRALKHAWKQSSADILTYMDVDLSTDLFALPPMVEALVCGGYDIGIGSRRLRPDLIQRGVKRELISRCYNILVKLLLRTKFSDAQCGFKGIRRDSANFLLPLVEDNSWFFDSELLIVAEKLGFRVFDQPVSWRDDPDSRVHIFRTACDDIRGLLRVRQAFRARKYLVQIPPGLRALDRFQGSAGLVEPNNPDACVERAQGEKPAMRRGRTAAARGVAEWV